MEFGRSILQNGKWALAVAVVATALAPAAGYANTDRDSVTKAFEVLAKVCAPTVHPKLLGRIGRVESGGNPYAIGVVGGHLVRQPRSKAEALATVAALEAGGWNYSMGLVQVNKFNLARYGRTAADMFDPCRNLNTGSAILKECYDRAQKRYPDDDGAVRAALSCYYSGDFSRGRSYAMKVAASAPLSDLRDVHPIGVVSDAKADAPAVPSGRVKRSERGGAGDARRETWFTTYGDDDEDGGTASERQRTDQSGE
ncbi:TPA: lytic transglycosylase domain-containing protein [Burkholderia cenocepacia]|uniref:lytic transglycosylase domain-containing protein n=1 Tax=Burkholderia TaxID=32008 RepID=UPI001F0577B0|nr:MULTISPECIES: lytic transglycosylase domain-containing protein [Burkholderia]MCQ4564193.1 lytic transglycosylase domain-containing protein [Burkholderia contaminans]MCW5153842.1 lytic transglycosylase domain-containing protein [Burkholderia cenocepacia]MCW5162029.1 lytic transglycosylase domain-containing protein [Burkholderia cenocepacia]MCW5169955.1 lytic transglycosylase domain-containing protein [Burkholderia cenocepacia]